MLPLPSKHILQAWHLHQQVHHKACLSSAQAPHGKAIQTKLGLSSCSIAACQDRGTAMSSMDNSMQGLLCRREVLCMPWHGHLTGAVC